MRLELCPECGGPLAEGLTEGLCSKCLMAQGLKLAEAASNGSTTAGDNLPRAFGDFELIEEIARGGMGVIYRARQRELDRMVAVKLLLFGPHASSDYVRRFRVEASAAASLHHPNIVTIHQVGVQKGEHYLVMDLVDGPNLRQFVKDQPLSAHRAAAYLKTIAEAIHYAHEHGILHRDLKPSNVLIDSNDQPRITDFGLAKRFEEDSSLTLSMDVLGSPSYIPPEQAGATRHKVGRRSDVYSLGAMLYHMLTGRPPFIGEGLNQMLDQVFNHEPVSPRLLNPAVPRDLEIICLKCLEKEPARRYPTAKALAEELGRFLGDEPIRARPVTLLEKVWRWCRRKPALATLVLLLHLVGAVGLAGILWEWRQAKEAAERAEARAYASDMSRAQKALEDGNLGLTRRLLDRHRPVGNSKADLRGWEWRYLWGLSRGDELATIACGAAQVESLAYSPDGGYLATGDSRGNLRIFDAATRKQLAWLGSPPVPEVLQFSANGRSLVSAGYLHGLRLWDWNPPSLTPHIAFLSDTSVEGFWFGDSELIAVNRDRQLRSTWETVSGRELNSIPIIAGTSIDLEPWSVFSSDGHLLATSTNNAILLWDAHSGAPLATLTNHQELAHPLCFSKDGTILASGDAGGTLKLWDVATGREIASAPAHQVIPERADFSPDNKWLVTCSYDHTVKIWEVSPWRAACTLRGHLGEVYDARFAPDGKRIASASADGTVKLWNSAPKSLETPILSLSSDLQLWSLAPDGRCLLLVFGDQTFSLWDLEDTHSCAASPRQPLGGSHVTAAAVFTGGRSLAFGLADGRVMVKERDTLRTSLVLRVSGAAVTRLGCSSDGHTLAAQDTNNLIKAWTLPKAAQVASFSRTNHFAWDRLPVSPDGRTLVTASLDGTLDFWTLPGLRLRQLQGSESLWVTGVAFFRENQRVATCSVDKTARLWDLASPKQPLSVLYSDLNGLRSLALSPDQQRLAVGDDMGAMKKVKLFDLATGQEVAALAGHKQAIMDLAFWPDGNAIVSVSRDAVCVWRAPSWEKIEAEEKRAP